MNRNKALACGLAAAIVALSGCTPAIYTVGGTIPSTNPSKGATKAPAKTKTPAKSKAEAKAPSRAAAASKRAAPRKKAAAKRR